MAGAAALLLVLMGLQLKFHLAMQMSGDILPVSIAAYYVTDPDNFTGEDFQSVCNILSPGVPPLKRCEGNSLRLTDDVTGEGSPLNTDQFIGWSSSNQDRFIIAPDLSMNLLLRQVDIYFHNSPAMGIGLPAISLLQVAYTFPNDGQSIGPIRFTYANNQHPSQSDSSTTMISVIITEEYVVSAIAPYDFIRLNFDFSSHLITQSLISEIRVFSEPVSTVTSSEITFLPGTDETELGIDNLVSSVRLSCTVASEGLFSWSWTGPNGTALATSHTSVFMADLTRTSILEINNLSLSDAGQYTCTASVFDGLEADPETARSSSIDVSVKGSVSTSGSLAVSTGEQDVLMTCDFSGYLPGAYTITWTGPQGAVIATSDRHTIVNGDGVGQSQSGGGSPGPSVLSTLTISTVEEEDNGTYTCQMNESNNVQLLAAVELIVLASEIVVTPSPSSTTANTSGASRIPLIVGGVVGGGVLAVAVGIVLIILILVLISYKCKKRSFDLSNPPMESRDTNNRLPFSSAQPIFSARNPVIATTTGNSTTVPKTFQDNPMYISVDGTNHAMPVTLLSMGFAGRPQTQLVQQQESPPPIPSYHEAPDGNQCDEEQSLASITNPHSNGNLAPSNSVYSNPRPLQKLKCLLEVTEKNIREIKELGRGRFGRVVMAHTMGLNPKQLKLNESDTDKTVTVLVAIEHLKSDATNPTQPGFFEKEVRFMARLQHENVVQLLGVCLSRNAFVMMEYMENGDLNQFLRKHTLVGPDVSPLPDDAVNVPVLIYLSLQIASGMWYLASQQYVHKDLATRSCLVSRDNTVKIANFCITRDLYNSCYYPINGRGLLPIRWTANECFYGRFSEKSDVWAFGVTMWEVFTLCQMQPYSGMTDEEVIDNIIKGVDSVLLVRPSSCSTEVYGVMKQCWIHEPNKRASFSKVHQLLFQIHACTNSS